MFELTITLKEGFDETTNQFVDIESVVVKLEHSLVSLSKWESKWEKPFLRDSKDLDEEQFFDYIKCMLLDPTDAPHLDRLTKQNVIDINAYINSRQSAAWLSEDSSGKKGPGSKVVTSDLIYYWMVALTIPFECETWHLNRLITLIRITELENQPKKKMPRSQSMAAHRSILAKRRGEGV